jgi:hypothetical protein
MKGKTPDSGDYKFVCEEIRLNRGVAGKHVSRKCFKRMARTTRLELATSAVTV